MLKSNFYHVGDLKLPEDAEKFYNWLLDMPKNKFPLEVFVEGAQFKFVEQGDALYFCLGWEIRRDLGF